MTLAAFFDVDGTLYTAHMWRGLMRYAAEHGQERQVRLYYATHLPLYGLRKLSLIDEETFRKPWVSHLGWMLKNWTAEHGQAAFEWVADAYIRPTGHADTLECLRGHVQVGHVVILVSAMLTPTLQILGDALGATGVVGTDIEIQNGRYTGRTLPPVCMGIEKDRLTRRFLQQRGIAVDFANSYAYADSFSDRSLLEMVGHPVAVYPDAQLAALARDKGWEQMP